METSLYIFVLTLSLKLKKVRLRTTFASEDTACASVKLSCCEHYSNVVNEYSEPELKAVSSHLVGHIALVINYAHAITIVVFYQFSSLILYSNMFH